MRRTVLVGKIGPAFARSEFSDGGATVIAHGSASQDYMVHEIGGRALPRPDAELVRGEVLANVFGAVGSNIAEAHAAGIDADLHDWSCEW